MQIVPATCLVCGGEYDPLRARATLVVDGKVRAYCSQPCKEKASRPAPELTIGDVDEAVDDTPPVPSLWSRLSWRGTAAVAAAGLIVLACGGKLIGSAPPAMASMAPALKPPPPKPLPTVNDAMAMLASTPTPTERDLWYHPLPGPRRTLPERDTRRFGAAREGMRPEECAGGHCGVDIGTVDGMLVLASHDGVVERVQRDAEEGGRRGNEGRFIRINHKGGTVVTSYIHLDAIREDLRPGLPVKAGEAIATVGSTGVLHSGPHLHFAVSVRPNADGPELYIDPEPLLHLWPLAPRPAATLHAMSSFSPKHPKTAQIDDAGSDL